MADPVVVAERAVAAAAAATAEASSPTSRRGLCSAGRTASCGTSTPAERIAPPSLPGRTQSTKKLFIGQIEEAKHNKRGMA